MTEPASSAAPAPGEPPADGVAGLLRSWKADALSGFLVFLIALPLCLGISIASGFPPFAGVMTAVIGGLVVTLMMGSPATIKGPAAGLIVIAVGAVEELGRGDAARGYRLAIAVVVASGLLQIVFGLMRAGRLGDFFPAAAVHGMLAAIGVIIAAKQVHVALGVKPQAKDPLGLLVEIPRSVIHANAPVATIGLVSLAIMFVWPHFKTAWAKRIPAQLVVLAVAVPLGLYFGLDSSHDERVLGFHEQHVGPEFLVKVPEQLSSIVTFPDFSELLSATSLKYVMMFALVGSLESILSSKAIDSLDPWRRKSKLDKDLIAVGVGNTLAGLVGGLPMISEIVRSSANLQNGGRTRWANFFHGAFLLGCVALMPGVVHRIPLAALAAMLVFTGYRLAAPKEFVSMYRVGRDQLTIFVATILATLATDLLVGVAVGVGVKLVFHLARGVKLAHVARSSHELSKDGDRWTLKVRNAALFTNYLSLRSHLERVPVTERLVVDLRETYFVDHTVLAHLEALRAERASGGGALEIRGLDAHRAASPHPHAVRVRAAATSEVG
ncbi:MAG: SulP family inorganic anion transporter [Labilithrix sp.]|nr:SulP family inorganic anion transporter [Labilithrix sp.]